jgi:plasmid stabilization system protein ParE
MKGFRLTSAAQLDLEEIRAYIAQRSPDAADRVLQRLLDAIERLTRTPGIGHVRPELDDSLRVWTVQPYLIIYRPDTDPLQVIRVVSGYRDLWHIPV